MHKQFKKSLLLTLASVLLSGLVSAEAVIEIPYKESEESKKLAPKSQESHMAFQNVVISNPIIIEQPGSYRLTSNLIIQGGMNAIEITTSNVTLDLNGFSIMGEGAGGPGSGIVATGSGPLTNITIVNGSVSDTGQVGIELGLVESCRIEKLNITRCNVGIISGLGCLIKDNVISGNLYLGLQLPHQPPFPDPPIYVPSVGFGNNIIFNNNGNNVDGFGIEIGINVCDGAPSCFPVSPK